MSFQELTKRISPKLKAITHKLDGRYTTFNDEDLYQEALIHLWQQYNEGVVFDKTDSYILQGCFFFLKNHIRKIYKTIDAKSNSMQAKYNDTMTLEDKLVSDIAGSECALQNTLLRETVEDRLEEREKKVLSLYLDDLTTREIGRRCGISHVMVIKILHRISNKMQPLKAEFV